MMETWQAWIGNLHEAGVFSMLRAALLLVVGLLVGRVASAGASNALSSRLGPHRTLILQRLVLYGIAATFAVAALREVGFELGVLLGAAGVLSVAIGFASQTAASNLVSGLFLIAEAPFEIGEVVSLGDTTGEVLSIDLLSIKLRTFDNLLVRIPNENVMKAKVTNLSRFPVRRFDLVVTIAYRHDLSEVERVLMKVADDNPMCLEEPKPLLIVLGFRDSGVEVQFSAWALRENFLEMRNSLHRDTKESFDAAGIEIPYPHRQLLARPESVTP